MTERTSIFSRMELKGRTAVITGGSKGIGKSLAKAFSEAGAKVLIGARNEADLKSAAAEISAISGNPVEYVRVDLADRDSTKQFAVEADKILGGVDIFVANAAIEVMEPVDALKDESIDMVMEVNLTSNIVLTREFSKNMKAKGWGRCLYITSAAALVSSNDGHSIYSSTKSALHGFARTVAVELGTSGVTANSLPVGVIETEMSMTAINSLPPEIKESMMKSVAQIKAVGRWGKEEEIEGVALMLCSDAGSFITGATIPVDGGMSIRMRPDPTI